MNKSTANRALVSSFIVAVGFITYQEIAKKKEIPPPGRFINAAVAYGMLGLLSAVAPEIAGLIGIGLFIALTMNAPFMIGKAPTPNVTGNPDPGTVPAGPGTQSGTRPQLPGQTGPRIPVPPSGHYPSTPPSYP